ncbi:MAG: wax ester/triacylglycerol synthase family O-acyltransferase [Pseudomonadota bacterium]
MKQLSGLDATFLYMETPETPMHVAGFNIYQLPEDFEGSFHKHFTEFFKSRVHLVSIFNVKLAKTVFELDHPGWVDADPLDFDHHIKSAKLPAPGTFQQLEEMVADLHSQPLDMKKPLWQFTVIEGLKNNQAAIYSKVHHALVDGSSGMEITQALFDLGPVPREVKPPLPKEKKRIPTKAERAILGMHDLASNVVRQNLAMMEAVPQAMGQMAGLAATAASGKLGMPQLIAPKTPFNGTIGQSRSYCARTVSLMDVKAICKETGTKVNDVVMAICSGALRNYLNEKHKLPDASLTAFVPISTRTSGNSDSNNQVFGMNCPLATNYSNPIKRLEKIHSETGASKAIAGSVQDISPKDFTLIGAPTLLPAMMNMYGKSGLANILPNAVNVTISNNAGPPFPMYCAGAKLLSLYPVSIPIHGIGLNLTVQSYLDHLDFGLTADQTSVPDIAHLGDLLVASFEELRDAVLGKPKKTAAKRKQSAKK